MGCCQSARAKRAEVRELDDEPTISLKFEEELFAPPPVVPPKKEEKEEIAPAPVIIAKSDSIRKPIAAKKITFRPRISWSDSNHRKSSSDEEDFVSDTVTRDKMNNVPTSEQAYGHQLYIVLDHWYRLSCFPDAQDTSEVGYFYLDVKRTVIMFCSHYVNWQFCNDPPMSEMVTVMSDTKTGVKKKGVKLDNYGYWCDSCTVVRIDHWLFADSRIRWFVRSSGNNIRIGLVRPSACSGSKWFTEALLLDEEWDERIKQWRDANKVIVENEIAAEQGGGRVDPIAVERRLDVRQDREGPERPSYGWDGGTRVTRFRDYEPDETKDPIKTHDQITVDCVVSDEIDAKGNSCLDIYIHATRSHDFTLVWSKVPTPVCFAVNLFRDRDYIVIQDS